MSVDEYLYLHKKVRKMVNNSRWRHIRSVEKMGRVLATKYGAKINDAIISALFHDCAKGMDNKSLYRYVKKNKVKVPEEDNLIFQVPSILHSYVSAHIAREKFGIKKREILQAIERHTIGDTKMSLLDKIIYVADICADDRKFKGVEKIRELAMIDINRAYLLALETKITFLLKMKKKIHIKAIEAWNAIT